MECNNIDVNLVRRLGFQFWSSVALTEWLFLAVGINSFYYKEQVFGSGDTRLTLTYLIGFMWAVIL